MIDMFCKAGWSVQALNYARYLERGAKMCPRFRKTLGIRHQKMGEEAQGFYCEARSSCPINECHLVSCV